MSEPARHHRPIVAADLERLVEGSVEGEPSARMELAHATAAALVSVGRDSAGDDEPTDRLVRLADTVGLDTLADLWRGAPPDSLPGALWALYLLRTWCTDNGSEVARLYRTGRSLAPVDEVVAGVRDDADPNAIAAVADDVLNGLYQGDLDVALERGAAFFRVVAAGREFLAADGPDGDAERDRAGRNRACADGLGRAADGWRDGSLP
ncbi:hypothetical protein [Cryptosporangium arvum]|uniref:hypothetical protein n=1 Tax=Cryptosporangium arvum TaxID=80871 RepID=UPI0004B6A833|nr:hypothetical protein [Cryptosporangium arvum]